MQLRPYQEKQLEFLISKDREPSVVALESPTGSGKSIVIIEYIKHLFANSTNKTVVITTGSNNLVFEFAATAEKFGLDPIIFVGSNMLTCYDLFDFDVDAVSGIQYTLSNQDGSRIQIFSTDESKWCSTEKMKRRVRDEETGNLRICDQCRTCKKPHLKEVKEEMKDYGNHLIITNHQAYLTHAFGEKPFYQPNLVIVDEAHLFSTFYSNWMNVEIDKTDLANIMTALKKKNQAKVLSVFLENGEPIPQTLILKIIDVLKQYYMPYPDMHRYANGLCDRLLRFNFQDRDSEKYYYDISPDHMRKVVFWSNFNIGQGTIRYRLFSATIDRFTRIMFGMDPDSFDNFYKERNLKLVDYTKSTAYIYKVHNFSEALADFIAKCEQNDFHLGLILSTTIENVFNLKARGFVGKYKVYTSLAEFKKASDDYKVLVGSRALFQGIDLPEINFVILNKIPFETYDEEFIKRTNYLKKYAGIDPWSDYSIPFVQNTMIQTTGRLWRGPDDHGIVAICDGRLDGRFKYLLSTITDVRQGINLYMVGNDPEPDNTEGFDEIVNDNIKE